MDAAQKAAIVSANKLWENASEIRGIMERYNLYLGMIGQDEEEGKVLLTQLIKDLPGWLQRLLDATNEAGAGLAAAHKVRFEPVAAPPMRRLKGA